ncbi:MAG: DinB family protein [Anaerolineales bacterium]|nr:DinB family protein [Anaerolineales bacterium]
MFAQRTFLIKRLNSARKPLEEVISQAPADKDVYKNWTIKQIMDHMSGWDDVVIDALTTHAKGKPITPTVLRGIDAYNAETTTSRQSLDLEHSKKEFQNTREILIKALNDLPDEKFDQPLVFPWGEIGTVADLIEIFIEHEESHCAHVHSWLKNPVEIIGEH